MADYGEAVKLWREEREEPEEKTRDPKSGPGVMGALLRGVALSPASTLELVEPLRDYMAGRERPRAADVLRRHIEENIQIPAPVTGAERIAQAVGEETIPIIGFAPMGAAAGPAGLATEVGLGVVGSGGAQAAKEAGFGPAGQVVSGAIATAMSPAAVPVALRRSARQGLKEAGEQAVSETARRIAKKYGVEVEQVQRAASELKRRIGDERALERARGSLGDERLFADLPPESQPTSRQYLGRDAAQNISSMEESLARQDVDFSTSVANRKANAFEDTAARFEEWRPQGSAEAASEAFDTAYTRSLDEAREAWRQVPLSEMPKISTRRLKEAARESVDRAGRFPERVPREAKVVLELPDTISMDDFQNIRSQALLTKRVAQRGGEQAQYAANNLDPLLSAFNRELDSLSSQGSDMYRRALGLTRRNRELFDARSPVVKALSQGKRTSQVVRKIKGTPSEARRAVRIVSQEPGGLDSLRRALIDDLIGESFGDVTPRRIRSQLKEYGGAYSEVFDEEHLETLRRFADELDVLKTGKAGTPAATASTGTGISPLGIVFGAADTVRHPVQAAGRAFGAVKRAVTDDIANNPERSAILREALLDRQTMLDLLNMPDERALPAWMVRWKQLVARARERERARRAAVAKTAGRTMEGGER